MFFSTKTINIFKSRSGGDWNKLPSPLGGSFKSILIVNLLCLWKDNSIFLWSFYLPIPEQNLHFSRKIKSCWDRGGSENDRIIFTHLWQSASLRESHYCLKPLGFEYVRKELRKHHLKTGILTTSSEFTRGTGLSLPAKMKPLRAILGGMSFTQKVGWNSLHHQRLIT